MSTEKLHIIITGGTIDKHYDPPTQLNQMNDDSVLPSYFSDIIKPHLDISYDMLCMCDSNEITDEMRADILSRIQNTSAQHIIITHGTDTMPETARQLDGQTGDKTVILTGAMIPLKEFAMSDGGFNLGFAIAEALSKPAGVYLSMNAKSFAPDKVAKNFDIARFEDVDS